MWAQRGSINSNVVAADVKLAISGSKIDIARDPNADISELGFVQAKNWERNQVDDLKLKFSTFDDALQLTIRESGSSYSADPNYLFERARKNHGNNVSGPERLSRSPGDGHADLQRLDWKVFDLDAMGITAFGFRKEVDPSYMSFTSAKAKDEFAAADQSGGAGGAKLRLGTVSLTSSYGNYERLSDSATMARQDHTIAWDTSDVRNRLQSAGLALFAPVVPTSLSVTRFDGQRSFRMDEQRPSERTSGYAATAAWNWSSGYGNVSYWDYRLDSERIGTAAYAFAGRGLDIGFGTWRAAWGLYGGASYYRSDDRSLLSRSVAGGYDAYASVTYKLDDLPDLSLTGNFGQYDYEGIVVPVSSSGVYWSATIGFDFSKWLRSADGAAANKTAGTSAAESSSGPAPTISRFNLKSPVGDKPSLKVFYRYAAESADETAGGKSSDNHLVGAVLRGRF